jgi:hypothetical protein
MSCTVHLTSFLISFYITLAHTASTPYVTPFYSTSAHTTSDSLWSLVLHAAECHHTNHICRKTRLAGHMSLLPSFFVMSTIGFLLITYV